MNYDKDEVKDVRKIWRVYDLSAFYPTCQKFDLNLLVFYRVLFYLLFIYLFYFLFFFVQETLLYYILSVSKYLETFFIIFVNLSLLNSYVKVKR